VQLLSQLLHLLAHLLHLAVQFANDPMHFIRRRSFRTVGMVRRPGLAVAMPTYLGQLLFYGTHQVLGLFVQAGGSQILGGDLHVSPAALQFLGRALALLLPLFQLLHELVAFAFELLGFVVPSGFA